MAWAQTGGRGRVMRFAASESWREFVRGLRASPLYFWRFAGPLPERLLIAPTDLRTADPTVAHDIYSGMFVFAGQSVDGFGESPFQLEPPTPEWSRQLHSFAWLRHLRASDMALSRANARAMVDDWIRLERHHYPQASEPEVMARRIIAWLGQAPLILDGCDYDFYRRFMRSLTRQVRQLRRTAPHAPPGLVKLRILIAITAASLSMAEHGRSGRHGPRWLELELARQILPDGGHIGRNPGAVLDLLADLLPLRQAFSARELPPPADLVAAIDRMMPMLRFFRHSEGSFARFNGMGDTPLDLLATVLAYDDARGEPIRNASHSGYQRIAAGPTTVIIDTGLPPPIAVSGSAHAGTLAFEFSTGRHLVVINCGVPSPDAVAMRRLARTTAAHSTVTFNDSSSSRFIADSNVSDRFGEVIVEGPNEVVVERSTEEGATTLLARHDGYLGRYGVVHQRRLAVSSTGDRIEGVDSFVSPSGRPVGRSRHDAFEVRFHLHPQVSASQPIGNRNVLLILPDGEMWEFETNGPEAVLEDSILFSDLRGSRRTDQIVVAGRVQFHAHVEWRFRRTGMGGRRQTGPS